MSRKLSRLVVGISTGAVLGLLYYYFKQFRERKEADEETKKNFKKTVNSSETVYNGTISSCDSSGEHVVISGREDPTEALKSVLEAAENEEKKIEQQKVESTEVNKVPPTGGSNAPKPEDKSTTMEMTIPKDIVAGIIGKRGNNIKKIQYDSNTRINFKDETLANGDRLCVIRGRPDDVNLAHDMIKKYVASQPVLTSKEIMVPYMTVGRIIGRSGETIRGIQDMSKAKVMVDSTRTEVRQETGELVSLITIRGTQDQIEMAESLIQEKVDEDQQFKNKIKGLTATRTPRRVNSAAANSKNDIVEEQVVMPGKPALRTEGISEIFVSCVYHPNMFWIQLLGRDSIELDKLGDLMTEYYRENTSREESETDFQVGDIVASPFQDEKMYRARVISISEDGKMAEVEYVDYGDRRDIEVQQLRTLLSSYLGLKFQAIEATLNLTCSESKWSDDAITKFCEATYCAQWKALTAKVKGYLNEGEPIKRNIVWLELMDKDINIGGELIKEGYARKEEGRGNGGGNNRKSSGNAHHHHESL